MNFSFTLLLNSRWRANRKVYDPSMRLSSDLFEAFSKCPTRCWLRAAGETGSGNAYAEWVKSQNASYRAIETDRLLSERPKDESVVAPAPADLKSGKWHLAAGMVVQVQMNSCVLQSELHAVERTPFESQGRPTQFIPIRFAFTNKLDKDDKLLLAFDAL